MRGRWIAAALACVVLAAPASAAAALRLVPIPGPGGTTPFKSAGPSHGPPIYVASPPGDAHRAFVVTQDGFVYVLVDGVVRPTPFLDIHAKTGHTLVNGLFTIAFDPAYATNRRFYVNYTDLSHGDTSRSTQVVVGYQRSASDPDRADPATEKKILEIPSPGCPDISDDPNGQTSAHYGGQMAFGPDGRLWLSVGDGGDGCGDKNRALDLNDLHGKLLRIAPHPERAAPPYYDVPADNPLAGKAGSRGEVWAYGLRNPWRFSFDAATNDLVIGDVGEAKEDEIDVVATPLAAGAPPPFFGWPCREGNAVENASCPVTQAPVAPRLTYTHAGDCTSMIGGYVLHDAALGAGFDGRYLYGFWCGGANSADSGKLFTTDLRAASPAPRYEQLSVGFGLGSFGVDGCGHPYVMNQSSGGLWRLEGPTKPPPCDPPPPPAAPAPVPTATSTPTASARSSEGDAGAPQALGTIAAPSLAAARIVFGAQRRLALHRDGRI